MSVPLLMTNEAMRGTGYYPGSEEQTYRMEIDQLSLAGTAEVPLTAYHMGEILNADELPKKFRDLAHRDGFELPGLMDHMHRLGEWRRQEGMAEAQKNVREVKRDIFPILKIKVKKGFMDDFFLV